MRSEVGEFFREILEPAASGVAMGLALLLLDQFRRGVGAPELRFRGVRALAEQLVDAERAHRAGAIDLAIACPTLEPTQEWVWDRFSNLEKGLMSNGVARPRP